MAEKISDKPIRDEKIKRLKTKILTEIDEEMSVIKNKITLYLEDNEYFDELIKRSFALLNLKEYIENKHTFQRIEAEYPDRDAVVYMVSDRDIDIWLQEDYSFVLNFLCEAKDCDYDVFYILDDKYFGYNFTSIFDRIIYDDKQKNKID